jgi:hypothetical protein
LLPYIRMWRSKGFSSTLTGTRVPGEGILGAVTTPTAKVTGFLLIGFSGHAHGNPSRYVPKAPPEPVGSGFLTHGTHSVPSISAASFRSITVTAGCNSVASPGSAAKILPGDTLLTGTPPISVCQGRRHPQTSLQSIPSEGGARGFLCRQKTTVSAS